MCIYIYIYLYLYIYIYHLSLHESHGPWSGIHDLRIPSISVDTTWNQYGGEIICHPYISYTSKYPTIRFPWYPTIYTNTFKISWLSQCISHYQNYSHYIYIYTHYIIPTIYIIYRFPKMVVPGVPLSHSFWWTFFHFSGCRICCLISRQWNILSCIYLHNIFNIYIIYT